MFQTGRMVSVPQMSHLASTSGSVCGENLMQPVSVERFLAIGFAANWKGT